PKVSERIGDHNYGGIALSLDEQQRPVSDLGTHRCMILRNHGLLATGDTLARAFHEIYFLERACQIQIKAMSSSELN
ncbi:class II aldolase/adducin family protein, partial [Escherichia coli]|uniref:class II aldolase/adducin family protein n=1 Tax=Escherichia coli TaxID=562 RepID=UPI001EDB1F6E